ncbi:DUF475 domain-containing protein [Dactylosporangium aurantiacum]|uniref:DUF475 domain-containing protein n=1 Tax=Dactylosporangium aurantiacum TaxID=35754 RepID=A0A9Q9MDX9_9ACTN|nr:DUF475 domain-containing protein [Dactylosporangium aurantiacum]MDG6101565.1 DUF475 domain-containing protein [Dactylosporangium aurantiacum]UWZ52599.1 DUF475 domain-containing protein [Dactylosporangium aurantiacum]
MFLKTFGWSLAVTAVTLVGAFFLGGPTAFLIVAILCVLEISVSFDNAVVNATVLGRMNAWWQRLFLTVGVLIAVFGMRLIFPLLLVGITAQLNPVDVVRLALEGGSVDEPGTYAALLHEAHPSIAAFGGMFLLVLFLDFIFETREHTWLTWLEKPLAKIGKLDQLSVVISLAVLVIAAETLAKDTGTVMVSGVLGIAVYILVNSLGELFENAGGLGDDEDEDEKPAGIHGDAGDVAGDIEKAKSGPNAVVQVAGKAAFFLFLYLEVLDASFSFDGVIGAFAISQNIFIIAAGLGVGAMYIRSLTVYLVRKGTLSEYVFLEHGAHWAIGALAAILLVGIKYEVPEVVTGLIGVGFILAAFLSSVLLNRRNGAAEAAEERAESLAGRS